MTRLILCALCLVFPACVGTTPPTLRVTDASVSERSAEAAVVVFTIEAANSNAEAMPLTRMEYQLSIDGRVIASGLRSAEATVRQHGRSILTLPVAIPMEASRQVGTLAYRLEGRLGYMPANATSRMLVDAGLRFPSTRFADEGAIAFSGP